MIQLLILLFEKFSHRTWKNWVPPLSHRERWVQVSTCPECRYVRHLVEYTEADKLAVSVPRGAVGPSDPCPKCGAYTAQTVFGNTVNGAYRITRARWVPTGRRWFLTQGKWQIYPDNDLEKLALLADETHS